ELLGGFAGRPGALPRPWGWIVGAALASATSAFLMVHYPWDALLAETVAAGGDMASLYYPTKLMAEEMLPRGQITGWTMGNYAGVPILHFYSTLPFAVIALLGKLWPMTVVFKVVTLVGPTLLPITAAVLFRALGYGAGAPAIAAASVLPFLMQQGNSMWGGNIPSVLAGEYCHAIGLSLGLVFLAQLHRVVNGRGSWPVAGVLLAVIGLFHTFAFFAAAWYSLFFLRPHANLPRSAPPILATYGLAFLLLCFWGMPLPSRLVFTTEWSMIWHIKDWKEVVPSALWPAGTLAALSCLLVLVRVKRFEVDRMGLLLFNAGGGILLYYVVPALGFPDIRFIPVSQIFISLLAADFLAWLGSRLRQPHLYAACIVTAALAWGHSHLGYIPSWLKWNYSGYEGKPTWQLFKSINDHIAGDFNDPRVMFEHAEAHNRFGSSRAFENIPLFSGRATLEGVFHQASQSSPFIFYLQSEASERASGPFPQHTYTRLDPAKALPHMRLFNVSEIVVVSDKAKAAYDANPDFEKTFSSGAYAVYKVRELDTRYVVPATNEPVLYDGPDWKIAFYRWYKHPELLDIPLVPAELLKKPAAREFALRTDSITRLPKQPIEGDCNVTSHLENYRIEFETDCPGRPHILKVSYFPRWVAGDTADVYPVSPGFMLVYPHQRQVVLEYKRTALDWAGVALTLIGVLLAGVTLASRRARDAITALIARLSAPAARVMAAHRVIVSAVAVVVMVGIGAYTRLALRAPERTFQAAQDAYKKRDFPEAIRRLEEWTSIDKDTFKQATALHQLGLSYSEMKQYGSAVEVLERLRFEFPNVDYGAATLFHLAKAWDELGDRDKARAYATILAVDFADSPLHKRIVRELPDLLPAQ
ncbi:MAG TPA: 6-pyruvoyl-tetrahydropterin synthase-related protein, partial [Candidatus Binatia bacterium]|nr:6-pyruvoyl-tetrahydropterin synthase-related protein [Candidatus Binatia bacterium]